MKFIGANFCSQETTRAIIKKRISIVIASVALLSFGLNPAKASLLGMPMPIDLKAGIGGHVAVTPTPGYEFYTDGFFEGSMLVKGC